jgi:cell wall-associated NlpC family hydrolase
MVAVPASATPSKAAKMAQARAVTGQISDLQDRIEIANENFNEAKSAHAVLLAQSRSAWRREMKAKRRIGVLQTHLGTRASDMYRTGPLGFLDVLLGAKSFDQLAATWDILKDLNKDDSKAIAEMKVAKAEAAAAHKELAAKEQASAKQVAIMNSQLDARNSHLAALRAKRKGIEAELAQIAAAEERAAIAAARSNPGGGGGGDGGNWPNPTIPAHGTVVTYARSRLGCRYIWAGTGPRVFDCSGFTQWCYRQIGISLPHSSRAQINCGQRVSRANLEPGDLVFFGSPIHHVGMYIGGGMMIHAPHSGDVVKIAPAFRGNYVGACRP